MGGSNRYKEEKQKKQWSLAESRRDQFALKTDSEKQASCLLAKRSKGYPFERKMPRLFTWFLLEVWKHLMMPLLSATDLIVNNLVKGTLDRQLTKIKPESTLRKHVRVRPWLASGDSNGLPSLAPSSVASQAFWRPFEWSTSFSVLLRIDLLEQL